MEIEKFVIVTVVAIVAGIVGFWVARRSGAPKSIDPTASETVDDPTVAGDIVVLSGNGEVMLSCREIDYMPGRSDIDDGNNSAALNRATQLATELITRSMTLPGKTVEIAFDPAIQRGLSAGAYEVVKVASGDGQRLMARATDSKKFVGQGRFMAAGKLKQIGIGAFHIVSIAVAQAHLAEINKNLEEIKEGVKDIRDFLEDKDIAQLRGTIEYLEYVVDFIRRMDSPDLLPTEKRAELESIRREMMVWVAQIELEAGGLRERIEGQGDEDGFGGGTGDTFGKLKEHARAAKRLIHKYKLLLRTASLFYMTSAYLDPMALRDRNFTRILKPDGAADALMSALQQLAEKSEKLLSGAIWNKKITLLLRQKDMEQEVQQLGGQTLKEKRCFSDGMGRLEGQLSKIGDPQGNVRMAITFDCAGTPANIRLVSES